jgi:hypothetical protein
VRWGSAKIKIRIGIMEDGGKKQIPEKKRRKRKVSAPVMLALEALAVGRARTIVEAASMASLTPSWLGKMLRRPEIGVMVDEMAKQSLRLGKLRASHRAVELVDHDSGRVSLEASRLVLGIGGISPPRDGFNVNLDLTASVGYVIDLSGGPREPPPLVDITPGAEHPSAVPHVAPKGYLK